MLEVLRKPTKSEPIKGEIKKPNEEIIVTKTKTITEEKEDGTTITRRIKEKVNMTKAINETKKLFSNDNAKALIEKMEEVKEAFTKSIK